MHVISSLTLIFQVDQKLKGFKKKHYYEVPFSVKSVFLVPF
jgi:hypothetical protein